MSREQAIFGAGLLWGTPTADAQGNAISNGTPLLFGTIQDVSVDISFEMKELYGSDGAFAKFVGRGKGKVDCSANMGTITGALLNSLFFGQTLTNGLISVKYDTVGAVIPTTPFQITPTAPSSGTWSKDLGVVNASDFTRLVKVASSPATGQYSVSAGVYTFASADAGNTVYINYEYTATVTGANHSTVKNLPMGYAPTFSVELYTPYQDNSMIITLNKCISNKLTIATKLDDFTMPQFSFSAFSDDSGNIMTYSLSK